MHRGIAHALHSRDFAFHFIIWHFAHKYFVDSLHKYCDSISSCSSCNIPVSSNVNIIVSFFKYSACSGKGEKLSLN